MTLPTSADKDNSSLVPGAGITCNSPGYVQQPIESTKAQTYQSTPLELMTAELGYGGNVLQVAGRGGYARKQRRYVGKPQ